MEGEKSESSESGTAEVGKDVGESDKTESISDDLSKPSSHSSSPVELPEYQYSRSDLIKLRDHPSSRNRPPCLSKSYDSTEGLWDPERWFNQKPRADSPYDQDRPKRDRPPDLRDIRSRKTSDPKERLREEERDDIVLSPQRRSFGTGCHVNHISGLLGRRPKTPQDNRDTDASSRDRDYKDRDYKDKDIPQRRIGSGRILSRDRDYDDRGSDRGDRGGSRGRYDRDDVELSWRGQRNDREPRSFRSDFRDNRRDNSDRRLRRESTKEEEEPEWFSAGPSSQSDTIELHGFESYEEEKRKRKEKQEKKDEECKEKEEKPVAEEPVVSAGPDVKDVARQETAKHEKLDKSSIPVSEPAEQNNVQPSPVDVLNSQFDFNEFFKVDGIPGFSENLAAPAEDIRGSSRFSHLFMRQDSHGNSSHGDSRRSSFHEELFLHDVLHELDGSHSPMEPSPTADISSLHFNIPYGQRGGGYVTQQQITGPSNEQAIISLLQKATPDMKENLQANNSFIKEQIMAGKAKSVAELEAGMAEQRPSQSQVPPLGPQQSDMDVFNKLVEAMKAQGQLNEAVKRHDIFQESSNVLGAQAQANQRPIREQDLLQELLPQQVMPPAGPTVPNSLPIQSPNQPLRSNEQMANLFRRHQHAQQQITSHPMAPAVVIQGSPSPQTPTSRNLGIPGLVGRTASPHDLLQLQRQQQRIPSPVPGFIQQPPVLPHAPSPIYPGQVSPSGGLNPPTSPIPRVPSPQELIVHTQTILQNALIKKKLEEQKENFRKRHQMEMQKAKLPNQTQHKPAVNPAFTPTSVIKNLHNARAGDDLQLPINSTSTNNQPIDFLTQSLHGESHAAGHGDITEQADQPRAVTGQGFMQTNVPTMQFHQSVPPVAGRPILKGNQTSPNHQPRMTVPSQNMAQAGKNIPLPGNIPASMMQGSTDISKLLEQQQHALHHKKLTASPLPQRSVAIVPPQPQNPQATLQQASTGMTSAVTPAQAAILLHNLNMINPAAVQAMSQLQHQLAAANQIRGVGTTLDPRVRGINPLLQLQQLQLQQQLQNQQRLPGLNVNLPPPQLGSAGLTSPQIPLSRTSPVGLAKWFGQDFLKQQQLPPPPLPTTKALSVDELERLSQVGNT